MPPCHGGDRGFDPRLVRHKNTIVDYRYDGPIAQSVEQWIENPCVAGSIPAWATTFKTRMTGFFIL